MKFTEDKAKEIIKKYGLSEKTINVWKTRGSIPNKYSNPNFKMRGRTDKTKAEKLKEDRLLSVLKSNKINKNTLEELCNLRPGFLSELLRNKTSLTADQLALAIKELKQAMTEIKALIAKKKHKDILKHPLFFAKHVLNLSSTDYHRIIRLNTGEAKELEEYDYKTIRDRYFILTLELSRL